MQVQVEDASRRHVLEIPVGDSGEVVALDLDHELPEDPDEICTLLENEKSAAEYWLAIGSAYVRNGVPENGVEVVQRALQTASVVQTDADKVPLHCLLAWIYLKRFRKAPKTVTAGSGVDPATGSATKDDFYRLATEASNSAFGLNTSWPASLLARGALALAVGEYDTALPVFQKLLDQSGGANVLAQMGRARVLYSRRNYRDALKMYQNVLLQRPELLTPDPRIGVGLCFWKLGDTITAARAWQRALDLNESNVAAQILLGLSYMHQALADVDSPQFPQLYSEALKLSQAAYKQDVANSGSALPLAAYMFSKRNMDGVLKLTKAVESYSDMKAVQSEGQFWMGRAYHFLEDYDQALKCYSEAEELGRTSLGPAGNQLASIGKGLVQCAQGATAEALITFGSLARNDPKCAPAFLFLGLLTGSRLATVQTKGTVSTADDKKRKEAVEYLEKYIRLAKEHNSEPVPECYLMLAALNQSFALSMSSDKALVHLEAVRELAIPGLSAQVLNNIGVYNYMRGNFDTARASFEQAVDRVNGNVEDAADEPEYDSATGERLLVTLTFNLARVEDATGNVDSARQKYHEVLQMRPGYLDAELRLNYLDLVHKSETGAEEKTKDLLAKVFGQFEALLADHPSNLEVRAMLGWFLKRKRRLDKSSAGGDDAEKKHLIATLVEHDSHDTFSLVSVGNIYLAVARDRSNSAERKNQYYIKATELFDKALRLDPYNAYAAQGLAIIFAETHQEDLALPIFKKVKETLNDVSIHLNLGHCLMDAKQFEQATESYEMALKLRGGHDANLVTLLGRAWYARGTRTDDLDALKTCLTYSERAAELVGANPASKFNVALVKYQVASVVLKLPESRRTLEQIEQAAAGLEEAIVSLREVSQEPQTPYPTAELEQRALMGENTLRRQLERALATQKEYETTNKDKLEKARQALREQAEREQAEKQRIAQERIEREKLLAEERQRLQDQAREWTEQRSIMAEDEDDESETRKTKGKKDKKTKEKGSKSKQSTPTNDDFIDDDDDVLNGSGDEKYDDESDQNDGDDNSAEAETKKKRESDNMAESSPAKRRRTNLIDNDSDEENANAGDAADDGDDDLFGDES